MMKVYTPIRNKPKSLSDQIKDIECGILNHQRKLETCTAILVPKIYQQVAAPGTLLLASGIGFILGEFIHCNQVLWQNLAFLFFQREYSELNLGP
jgi:hypothetical protein